MQKSRLSKGGALVVVLISALVLVILGVGFIFFSKIFGGGREMQNAVDSGSLNAAKTALLRPGTDANTGDRNETQFLGFENQGNNAPDFSLGNINRVWGQALLVSLNYKAMQAEGSAGSTANRHATDTVAAAKAINNRIADALKPSGNLPPNDLKMAFLNTSNSNTLKMVSANANDQVEISSGAQVGFQNKNGEGNIYISSLDPNGKLLKDIVDADDISKLSTTINAITAGSTAYGGQAVIRPDGQRFSESGGRVVNGYQDISIDDDKKIYFVPLRPEAKPHMLAGTEFNASQPTLSATDKPVSNSFLTKGKMKEDKSAQMLDFAAIALAEPVDPAISLSIPRGYIKVKNWKGFSTVGTSLQPHTNNAQVADNQNGNRGMHAAEYANHQLLMARSNYGGPGRQDEYTYNMGMPYYGLVGQNDQALRNDAGEPVFGRQQAVQELIDINEALAATPPRTPPSPAPDPSDPTCGDRFTTHLPSSMNCRDITDAISRPAEVSLSVNGNGDVVPTNPDDSSALAIAITHYMVDRVHDAEDAFGSDIHPHIWSIDPQQVAVANNNVANFLKTGSSSDDPYRWMYTGQRIMPNDLNKSHYSRNGEPSQSPVSIGRAGTIWEYIQNAAPQGGASAPVEQLKVLNRLTQRVLEIKPDFAQGQDVQSAMQTLLSSAPLDMNQDAYVFMDQTTHQMQVSVVQGDGFEHVAGAQMPQWLKDQVGALGGEDDGLADGRHPELLGKTVFYGQRYNISTQPTSDNHIENVPGDWGYTEPYTNADNPPPGASMVDIQLSNKYVFRPCTGYQGQLAVLELKAFIHNPGCQAMDYAAPAPVYPEECPCVTYPAGSNPCPTCVNGQTAPIPTSPNAPNGWNQGPGTTDTGLPNCSHTGAC